MGRNVCDSDVICNSCSSKLYRKLKVDEDVGIGNVSNTPNEQFHNSGQAVSLSLFHSIYHQHPGATDTVLFASEMAAEEEFL